MTDLTIELDACEQCGDHLDTPRHIIVPYDDPDDVPRHESPMPIALDAPVGFCSDLCQSEWNMEQTIEEMAGMLDDPGDVPDVMHGLFEMNGTSDTDDD